MNNDIFDEDSLPGPEEIKKAANRIQNLIHHTQIISSSGLNDITGSGLFFKCENFQKAGAFKSRGACNTVFSLSDDTLKRGVCTHSSGNHAQALSRAALLKGIKAYIVMPENSLTVKIDAVKNYGGYVHFCPPTLEARETTLIEVKAKTGALEIHPYNNYRIIAGQASAALEFIKEIPDLDYIVAPVGGGGLLSGTALSALYFSPKTKVIAAEPEQAKDAYLSFKSGNFVPSVHTDTIADGLRTSLGTLTFPIIMKYVHDIITVSEPEIIYAMKLIWERLKITAEPSSAVALAAVIKDSARFKGYKTGLIISGGNVDTENFFRFMNAK